LAADANLCLFIRLITENRDTLRKYEKKMDYKDKHLLYFTWKTNRDSGGVYPHSVTSNNVVALAQDRLEEFGRKVPLEYNSVTPTLVSSRV